MKQGDFTEMAKHYHNRPAYSPFLLSKLIACINERGLANEDLQVVEVGAGTGKLTELLARDFHLAVTAVEPNDAMRAEGEKATQGLPIKWLKGSGESTNLSSNSADWLIMASSFHWTDPSKSLPEFARVLKSCESRKCGESRAQIGGGGGRHSYFSILYNPRDIKEDSVFYEIEQEIKSIVPELNRVSSGLQNTKKWDEVLVSTGDFTDCFFMECAYKETWSKERYMGAWHSVNDIQAQAGQKRWEQILAMIESKIAPFDELEIPYKIRAWTARKVN